MPKIPDNILTARDPRHTSQYQLLKQGREKSHPCLPPGRVGHV